MSYGTLITSKPGEEEQFHFCAGQPVPADIFERERYFGPSDRLVNDGLGVPVEKMGAIDLAFGRFLKGIQDSSFVPREKAIVPSLDSMELSAEEILAMRHARCSTLSPDILRQSMRINFARFVQEVAGMSRKEFMAIPPAVKSPLMGTALLVGVDTAHDNDLNDADLLTPETRLFLNGYGEGCAEAVNSTLLRVGKSFLNRADLSRGSTRTDSRGFRPFEARRRGVEVGREAYYSTLDPRDLIERAKRDIHDCMPGLMLSLPRDVQAPILERLGKADEVRSAASSAGSRA